MTSPDAGEERQWKWRDLGADGFAQLTSALEQYAFTGTWTQGGDGEMTLTNRRHVALTSQFLAREDLKHGALGGFLPADYPRDLRAYLPDDGRPSEKNPAEERFLGIAKSSSSTRRRFCLALDYQTSTSSEVYKKFWAHKPDWLHPAVNGDVVHWVCPIPVDPSEAMERLTSSMTWSSPFPAMAMSGDAVFDGLCEQAWERGTISDEEEETLAVHVEQVLVEAFDFLVNILWTSNAFALG